MAKTRSGLGRGLSSLIGSSTEQALSQQERTAPVERVSVSMDEETKKAEKSPKNASEKVVSEPQPEKNQDDKEKTSDATDHKTPVQSAEDNEKASSKDEEVYSNKEDNFVIKEVVERPARVEEDEDNAGEEPLTGPRLMTSQAADEVDINFVSPNPDQPRSNFNKEDLEELAESIKKNGLLQPVLVRKLGRDNYQIIAGERRWQACKSLGWKRIPIRIKDVDDNKAIQLALVENVQRADLNPIEEAYGYRRMMERGHMTQSEVAQAVSKGRSTVANALRLLELPEDAQQLLFENKITAGHARAILSIPNKEGRAKLTEKLVNGNYSVRETEAMARLLSGKKNHAAQTRPPVPASYKRVARSLKESLGTNVRVKSQKGKNKIEIEFKDEEDLERLFKMLMKEES